MKIKLLCREENYQKLKSFFEDKGFEIIEESNVCFCEKSVCHDLKAVNNDIVVLFDFEKIDSLDSLIGNFKKEPSLKPDSNHIIGRKNEGYEIIKYGDIVYFSAYGNTIYCDTIFQKYEVQKKLYEIEDQLKIKGFIRISKSIIINIMKVNEIIPWFGGRLLLKLKDKKEELEVSRNYVQDFKKYLGF